MVWIPTYYPNYLARGASCATVAVHDLHDLRVVTLFRARCCALLHVLVAPTASRRDCSLRAGSLVLIYVLVKFFVRFLPMYVYIGRGWVPSEAFCHPFLYLDSIKHALFWDNF